METQAQKEHQWLAQLVGDWTYESEGDMLDGKPPVKQTGKERVRSLDGLWVVCESSGDSPDAGPSAMVMTLGYDSARKRYVGTFIASMMTHLWVYDGQLDAAEKVLTLDAEGPSVTTEGKTAKYKDRIEVKGPDHRVMTSAFLGDDGEWHQFMTANYRRAT
ncbi:MAG: DUF1579 domain-containing protein [Acidobacteria bacterium]|nr:DUF1579 domain-containing protein [Acidobacteriota bacterium]